MSIKLLHGWLYDPQDKLLSDLVDDLSYNQLVEKALTLQGSENDSDVSNYLVIKDFIDTAQLTVHGLCEIIHVLNDGEVVALFRNNHFSTICKQNSRLYLLVTDIGKTNSGINMILSLKYKAHFVLYIFSPDILLFHNIIFLHLWRCLVLINVQFLHYKFSICVFKVGRRMGVWYGRHLTLRLTVHHS